MATDPVRAALEADPGLTHATARDLDDIMRVVGVYRDSDGDTQPEAVPDDSPWGAIAVLVDQMHRLAEVLGPDAGAYVLGRPVHAPVPVPAGPGGETAGKCPGCGMTYCIGSACPSRGGR
jgi:hypothetical protein